MIKESKEMKEIHEIRVRNYEKTKDMTTEKFLEYIHMEADEARKNMKELRKAEV